LYSEHSYKYYFNQWGVNKNIPGPVKDIAIVALKKRSRDSTSTPPVFWNDHKIPKEKLQRHMKVAEKKRKTTDDDLQLKGNV